ncbi:unnamed protein product [Laminaria digitata]
MSACVCVFLLAREGKVKRAVSNCTTQRKRFTKPRFLLRAHGATRYQNVMLCYDRTAFHSPSHSKWRRPTACKGRRRPTWGRWLAAIAPPLLAVTVSGCRVIDHIVRGGEP